MIVAATKIIDYGVADSRRCLIDDDRVRHPQLSDEACVSIFECKTLPSTAGIVVAQKLSHMMHTMRREVWDDSSSFMLMCCGLRGGDVNLELVFDRHGCDRDGRERWAAAAHDKLVTSGGLEGLNVRFQKREGSGHRVIVDPSSCRHDGSFFLLFSWSTEMLAHGTELVVRGVPLLTSRGHLVRAVACVTIPPVHPPPAAPRTAVSGDGWTHVGRRATTATSGHSDRSADGATAAEDMEYAMLRDILLTSKTGCVQCSWWVVSLCVKELTCVVPFCRLSLYELRVLLEDRKAALSRPAAD
jgi:hypothetical protein